MVISRIANQPITFSGQIVAFGTGVANIEQSRIITGTINTPIRFTNSQGNIQFTTSDGNPAVYTTN